MLIHSEAMVDPPNFAHPFIDPKEQERLKKMTRNPVSKQPKVDMEKLKEQLLAKLTMPVFAPKEGWHAASGMRSRQKRIHGINQKPRDIG
jgi:hypothetical protein